MSQQLISSNYLPSSQDDINRYLSTINDIPVLTADEEKSIAIDLYDNHNLEAARELILHHLRFVVYIARNYRGYGLAMSDLIQEGNIGLMKAVKSFDPYKGVRLASFAVHWIKSEINEFVIRNWKIVKIATTKEQRKLFFNLRSRKKDFNWLNDDEAELIAKDLNVSKKQVYEMESRLSGQDIAFDASDSDDETDNSPSYWLASSSGEDPINIITQEENEGHVKQAIYQALSELDERSRDIVSQRWLNEDEKVTLHDLAAKYDVSAERVRQIENNAMKKIKAALSEHHIEHLEHFDND